MAENKRYFWLRLHDDFFDSLRIKKMRKMAGGDTYTIIYLKMQLKSIKKGGVLTFTGVEQDFASELALDIDESVEDVKMTLSYLIGCGLVQCSDEVNFFLPYAVENTGSETASTQRSRDFRQKQKVLHCNTTATQVQRECNAEIEIETEIEKEIERDVCAPTRETHPTVEEIASYCKERNNRIDPKHFYDYYDARGWMLGNTKMKDFRAVVRDWERREPKEMHSLNVEEAFAAAMEKSYGGSYESNG